VKQWIATIFAAALLLGGPRIILAAGFGEDSAHLTKIEKLTPVDEAVDKGLAWLVEQQDKTTGAFPGKHKNAYTGLACIALMAAGHFPNRSKYGENLRAGLMYLVQAAQQDENGYLGDDGGRMYGHGICTLAMTEAYGMMATEEENRKLREALAPAVKVILESQSTQKNQNQGGWRYNPKPDDSDLSVAAWQILALRSAQNCLLPIPQQAVDNALRYVRGTYEKEVPGFTYQGQKKQEGSAMRAAGVVCMLALGATETEMDRKMVRESAKTLLEQNPTQGGHFYYRCYYLATAANMMEGEYFKTLMPKIENSLLKLQEPTGAFRQHAGYDGEVYSTAFAIICLAVNYQYLPIYQE
jgi:hypothetical protein